MLLTLSVRQHLVFAIVISKSPWGHIFLVHGADAVLEVGARMRVRSEGLTYRDVDRRNPRQRPTAVV